MKKTIRIEGMHCGHCSARVQKSLAALDGVISAVADHAAGTATVESNVEIADSVLKNAVEETGFDVIGIE